MANLTVSKTRDYFEYRGRKFFYLADAVWPAFARISFTEWEEYLEYRRMQGFNVLQIWIAQNRSIFGNRPYAFRLDAEGNFDYYTIDEEYFERARKILEMATQKGFIPALAVLWSDKVKDTWLSKYLPNRVMPLDAVQHYAEYVAKTFSEFNPIYLVSGDTSFESKETSKADLIALDTIKSISPDALTTMHIWGDSSYLPDEIIHSSIDFYMYQSGHKRKWQHFPYQFAQDFYNLPVKRPIVNGEPCFEGLHGLLDWGKFEEVRFSAFDVRKAIWQSLLSGAKAGVGYGAFGIWPWCTGDEQWEERWEKEEPWEGPGFYGKPYHWRTALRFRGAWDASFAKWIFETYDLFDIEPQQCILNETREIRMSASDDLSKVVIYVPYAVDVKVGMELSDYNWALVNLTDRDIAKPEVEVEKGSSTIKMHCFNSDVLVIGVRY